jgi:hypothetical protein
MEVRPSVPRWHAETADDLLMAPEQRACCVRSFFVPGQVDFSQCWSRGLRDPVAPSKHTAYYDLLDACQQGGCPICTCALAAVHHYLDGIVYEQVNDAPLRRAVVVAHGLCNDHAWLLRDLRAGLGAALLFRDVLAHVVARIRHRSPEEPLSLFAEPWTDRGLRAWLAGLVGGRCAALRVLGIADPHLACPVCQMRERTELVYLGILLEHLGEEPMAQAFCTSGGLCLVHLDQAATTIGTGTALTRLLDLEGTALDGLGHDLDAFIRKHDYQFRDEAPGGETDAWIRAIALVAGKPGVR